MPDDSEVLTECPRCDALKEQLAELRGEHLAQAHRLTEMLSIIVKAADEKWTNILALLVKLIEEDRKLLREVLTRKP